MERKEFLQKFAVGGSLLLTAPVLFNSCSDGNDDVIEDEENSDEITIDLNHSDYSALGSVGGFAYKDDIIVIRSGETSYIALSKVCTHQGCDVSYNHDDGELPCPCHGSRFSTSGAVLQGPATTSLKTYSVKKEGNTLVIY